MAINLIGNPKNRASYVPTGRIWPSGDFSLGYRKVEGDSRVDYRREPNRVAPGGHPDNWAIGRYGVPEQTAPSPWEGLTKDEWCEWQWLKNWHPPLVVDCPQGPAGPLDLTDARNSHTLAKRPEKYGKSGITGYGQKMVRSAAGLIQKMPGKRVTFATVTMPPLPRQLRRELALVWPEFLRQLLQWLSRKLKRLGLIQAVCSVTEIQPGRLESYSEAYLHLHLVWPNHWAKSGNWSIDVVEMRAWCSEFLQSRGLWTSEAWVNIDTQQVKKTAAGYLSKYMSKGSDDLEAFAADCGWDAVPGQWWNLTKPIRDLVKKYTRSGDDVGALLDAVVNHSINFCELDRFYSLRMVHMLLGDRLVHVGWSGIMHDDFRRELISMITS